MVSTFANIKDVTEIWADGETHIAIGWNITDTDSAADSKWQQLKLDDEEKYEILKDGTVHILNKSANDGADYERLMLGFEDDVLVIRTEFFGGGMSVRNVRLQASYLGGFSYVELGASSVLLVSGTGSMTANSSQFFPTNDLGMTLGRPDKRWASVDTDVLRSTGSVDLTGIPTSDPAVAGRVWNDSGTLKLSAG